MKLLLLAIGLLPSLCHGDIIQWQDEENGLYVEQVDNLPINESNVKKHVDITVRGDRQDLYLDTLRRLEQIDAINRLPPTAAGEPADYTRSCSYARNVLLEYNLELQHAESAGKTNSRQRDINGKIADWESHVKKHCR
jgi:hypothetical protein